MISTKGRYALRVMLDLAQQQTEDYIPLSEIAERQEISIKYLERIAHDLTKGGIIQSSLGKSGGYKLKKNPSDITLFDILSAVDEELSPVACLKCGTPDCDRKDKCPTLPMWQEYGKMTKDYFSSITLSSLSGSSFKGQDNEYNIEYYI